MLLRLILISCLCLVASCAKVESKRTSQAIPVSSIAATVEDIPNSISAIGLVQPKHTVALKSQVDGIIQKLHVAEGDDVQAGTTLLTLDRRPFENAVRLAKSELAQAEAVAIRDEADAKRYTQLAEASVVSKEQYNSLIAQAATSAAALEGKRAALANAELQLTYTEIKAPITGRLGQFSFKEGSLVKANDSANSLVTINQLAPIDITFSLPDSLFPAIKKALDSNEVRVFAQPKGNDQTAQGKLIFVNNAIDPTTGTLALKAEFENSDLSLWPGAFATVKIELGREKNQVLVPQAAVQNGQQGPQIWVIKPDHSAELRKVTLGAAANGLVAIREGITGGEQVVIEGQLRLTPGAITENRASK